MIHHFAAWTGQSYCVAYHSPALDAPVALMDGMSEERAAAMAAKLNFESMAQAAMAARTPPTPARRSVRYFQNEDVHG